MGLSRTSLATFIISGGELAAALAATVIVNHVLPVDQRGQFGLLLTTSIVLFTISHFSLGAVVVRSISAKDHPAGVYAGIVLALTGVCLLVYFLLFFAGVDVGVFSKLASEDRGLVLLAILIGPFMVAIENLSGVLQGAMNIRWLNTTRACPRIVNLLLILGALLAGLITVRNLLVINVVGVGVAAALAFWYVTKMAPASQWKFSARAARDLVRQAAVLHVGAIAWAFCARNQFYFLKAHCGDADVGMFAVAVTLAESVLVGLKAVIIVLFPASGGKSYEEARDLTARVTRLFIIASLLLALAVTALSPVVMYLYAGRRYFPAIVPTIILLFGQVLSMAVMLTYILIYHRRWYLYWSVYMLGVCAASLALSYAFIPRFGALGAAIASSATFLLQFVYTCLVIKPLFNASPREFFLPGRRDVMDLIRTTRTTCGEFWTRLVKGPASER